MMTILMMNKFIQPISRVFMCVFLLLPTTVICAEVSTVPGGAAGVVNNNVPVKLPVSAEQAAHWQLQAEQWDVARSGEMVLSLPALRQLVRAWLSDKNKTIEIQYPGGEDGEFWVQELSDWLVSLGIPSKYIVTIPGSGADDVIKFKLRALRNASL